VLEGFDAGGRQNCTRQKPITLRHLMTHTAFATTWNGDMGKYQRRPEPRTSSPANAALKGRSCPSWHAREYGINIDFVSKAVEAASGRRLDAYLRDHMFAPLGMNDIGQDHGLQRQRLVSCMRAVRTNRWRRSRSSWNRIGIPHGWRRPLRHGGDYIKLPDDPQQGPWQWQSTAEARDGGADGPEHIGDLTIGKMTTMAPMYTNDADLYPISSRSGGSLPDHRHGGRPQPRSLA
jgi:CubicO group peptidase (beta-lactamase class C family)